MSIVLPSATTYSHQQPTAFQLPACQLPAHQIAQLPQLRSVAVIEHQGMYPVARRLPEALCRIDVLPTSHDSSRASQATDTIPLQGLAAFLHS